MNALLWIAGFLAICFVGLFAKIDYDERKKK